MSTVLINRKIAAELDTLTQSKLKITELMLMEKAAQACANSFMSLPLTTRFLIACGTGNNGGDGLCLAKLLVQAGFRHVHVWQPIKENRSALNITQENELKKTTAKLVTQPEENYDFVVDAIFGVGLNRPLSNLMVSIIRKLNGIKGRKIAIDVPSGLNADTGWDFGTVFLADETHTFFAQKVGFHLQLGPEATGRIIVHDLEAGDLVYQKSSLRLFDHHLAQQLMPRRTQLGHKYDFGSLAIIGGSQSAWGAGILAVRAGFRTGCGHVRLLSYDTPFEALMEEPSVMLANLKSFTEWNRLDAVAIGPGLGLDNIDSKTHLIKTIVNQALPVVMDADALTILSKMQTLALPHCVLTPHSGELSRLMNVDSDELEFDRVSAAQKCATKFQTVVLYKGRKTIITDNQVTYVLAIGDSTLAKAGTGDVLTGIIGALLARGLLPINAAALAAYIHARAAEIFKSQNHSESLIASDLLNIIPKVLNELTL